MHITVLFSFTRATYFMVDMDVPSAYVQFIRSILPRKPRSEIYTMLGLQSTARICSIVISPSFEILVRHDRRRTGYPRFSDVGICSAVFFPRVQADQRQLPPPKETSKALIQRKYQLVKNHDRVGRLADTWNIPMSLSRVRVFGRSAS